MNNYSPNLVELLKAISASQPKTFGPYFSANVIRTIAHAKRNDASAENHFNELMFAFRKVSLAAFAICFILSLWSHFHPNISNESTSTSTEKLESQLDAMSDGVVEEVL